MKKLILIITLILTVGSVSAGLVGHWNLNGNFDNDVGGKSPLALHNTTLLSYTNDTIGGSAAQQLSFPAFDGYTKMINVPNEGANIATNYTLVFDVKFPVISGWTALLDMGHDGDAEFFISSNGGGIGVSGGYGTYQGTVNQDTWYRIAIVCQYDGSAIDMAKYIDGSLVGTSSNIPTSRVGISSELRLFCDDGAETAAGMINSLAYYSEPKDATFISNLGSASAGGISSVGSNLVGLWNFNDSLVNSKAASKSVYLKSLAAFSSEEISGSTAQMLSYPAFSNTEWLEMTNDASTVPTQPWTLIFDVKVPVRNGYTCFYQLTPANDDDGDLFVRRSDNGIGALGYYAGTFLDDTWYRIAVIVSNNGSAYTMHKFIDGTEVGTQDYGANRMITNVLLFLTDQDVEAETAAGVISSIAYWDEPLSQSMISGFGGPSAGGIPVPEPASVILILTALAGLLIRK